MYRMSIKLESIKDLLASRGLNPSHQRMRILDHLMGRMDHPTVNMVHVALAGEMPTLSKATVYNTLNALVETGLLTVLTITPEETRYDVKRGPHHHFLCKWCGSILDVEVRCTYADLAEVDGHVIEDIHGYFKGTCKKCRKGPAGRHESNAIVRKRGTRTVNRTVSRTVNKKKAGQFNSKRGG
jgi:Fur family peroxide stress response transcriptional regulator